MLFESMKKRLEREKEMEKQATASVSTAPSLIAMIDLSHEAERVEDQKAELNSKYPSIPFVDLASTPKLQPGAASQETSRSSSIAKQLIISNIQSKQQQQQSNAPDLANSIRSAQSAARISPAVTASCTPEPVKVAGHNFMEWLEVIAGEGDDD